MANEIQENPLVQSRSTGKNAESNLKAFVISNGWCIEANLDTQKLANFLRAIGFNITHDVRQADIVVFYACGHLISFDIESRNMIVSINKLKKHSAEFLVWGCLPKINYASIQDIYNGPIFGPDDWGSLSAYFGQPRERIDSFHANILVEGEGLNLKAHKTTPALRVLQYFYDNFYKRIEQDWYIKVESGCKNCCTYCSDRLAFKYLKSASTESILDQLQAGLRAGYRHIFFVGRDLGSYGLDLNRTLADLLNDIEKRFPNQDYKLLLPQISPNSLIEIYHDIDEVMLSKNIFEIGSHIQSGSSKILKKMGKNFPMSDWIKVIKDISENFPQIRLRTSIMVGFPGETEEDWQSTASLLNSMLFDMITVHQYNERPGLPALALKGRISENIKQKRLKKMQRLAYLNNVRKRMQRRQIFY
jgi:MiaB/RimO family radical SAM methylthiotransferase